MAKNKIEQETEVLIQSRSRSEVEEILEFVLQLDPEGKKDFLSFIRGAKFAMGINRTQNLTVQ